MSQRSYVARAPRAPWETDVAVAPAASSTDVSLTLAKKSTPMERLGPGKDRDGGIITAFMVDVKKHIKYNSSVTESPSRNGRGGCVGVWVCGYTSAVEIITQVSSGMNYRYSYSSLSLRNQMYTYIYMFGAIENFDVHQILLPISGHVRSSNFQQLSSRLSGLGVLKQNI